MAVACTGLVVPQVSAQSSDPRSNREQVVGVTMAVTIHDADWPSADEHCEYSGSTTDRVRPSDGVQQLGEGEPASDYFEWDGPFQDADRTHYHGECDELSLCFVDLANQNGIRATEDATVETFNSGLARVSLPYTMGRRGSLLGSGFCGTGEVLQSGRIEIEAMPGSRDCATNLPAWVDGGNRITITHLCMTNDDSTASPPTARAAGELTSNQSEVVFDGSASSDPDGFIESFHWEFGDGTSVVTTSPIVNHTYRSPGRYQPLLTVTDNVGLSDRAGIVFGEGTDSITIENTEVEEELTAIITGPPVLFTSQVGTYDGSASIAPNGPIVEYRWTWSAWIDSVWVSPSPTVDVSADKYGWYKLELTVTDSTGATASTSRRVDVRLDIDVDTSSGQPLEGPSIRSDWGS